MTHTYKITGMTCSACTAKVKSELLKIDEVSGADVSLDPPQAVVSMRKHVPTEVLQEAISNAGPYTISEAEGAISALETPEERPSYYPLFLIFAYIAGVTLFVQAARGEFNPTEWMRHFMAGFFLVFSFFKLMNLRGFAEGYSSYDIVARKFPKYGFVYPFIELALGIAYLTGFNPLLTNAATFTIMSISAVGVIQSLMQKRQFQCACLGTVIRLPLSNVTLFEDLLMVGMSGIMLFMLVS